jgi:hypothetical protein
LRAAGSGRRIIVEAGPVPFLNEVRTEPIGETATGRVEGVVRVRGVSFETAGRRFVYQRHDPEAILVRGEDDIRRLPIASAPSPVAGFALPVAAYVAARLLLRRRRGR